MQAINVRNCVFAAWPSARVQARVYGSEAVLSECRFYQSFAHKEPAASGNDSYCTVCNNIETYTLYFDFRLSVCLFSPFDVSRFVITTAVQLPDAMEMSKKTPRLQGLIYHYLGSQRLAEKTLRDAAKIDPNSHQTWYVTRVESLDKFS